MNSSVQVEIHSGVGVITLNRSKKLNALDTEMLDSLVAAAQQFDSDSQVGAIIIRGGERAFAAGADIGDLAAAGAMELYTSGFSEHWDAIADIETPLVAAVKGYALGGGLELALICDIIVAGESARFGLPETTIGTIPGAGGTQRLVRVVGKSMAMEMILAGRRVAAGEALALGLISTISADDAVDEVADRIARRICAAAPLAVNLAKRAVLESFESGLSTGVRFERSLSAVIASSADRAEGARAFAMKEKPRFTGR